MVMYMILFYGLQTVMALDNRNVNENDLFDVPYITFKPKYMVGNSKYSYQNYDNIYNQALSRNIPPYMFGNGFMQVQNTKYQNENRIKDEEPRDKVYFPFKSGGVKRPFVRRTLGEAAKSSDKLGSSNGKSVGKREAGERAAISIDGRVFENFFEAFANLLDTINPNTLNSFLKEVQKKMESRGGKKDGMRRYSYGNNNALYSGTTEKETVCGRPSSFSRAVEKLYESTLPSFEIDMSSIEARNSPSDQPQVTPPPHKPTFDSGKFGWTQTRSESTQGDSSTSIADFIQSSSKVDQEELDMWKRKEGFVKRWESLGPPPAGSSEKNETELNRNKELEEGSWVKMNPNPLYTFSKELLRRILPSVKSTDFVNILKNENNPEKIIDKLLDSLGNITGESAINVKHMHKNVSAVEKKHKKEDRTLEDFTKSVVSSADETLQKDQWQSMEMSSEQTLGTDFPNTPSDREFEDRVYDDNLLEENNYLFEGKGKMSDLKNVDLDSGKEILEDLVNSFDENDIQEKTNSFKKPVAQIDQYHFQENLGEDDQMDEESSKEKSLEAKCHSGEKKRRNKKSFRRKAMRKKKKIK